MTAFHSNGKLIVSLTALLASLLSANTAQIFYRFFYIPSQEQEEALYLILIYLLFDLPTVSTVLNALIC